MLAACASPVRSGFTSGFADSGQNLAFALLLSLAVCVTHRRCPPPLPVGAGGTPRISSEESLLLIGFLRTLWRLSYQDRRDWLQVGLLEPLPVAYR
jgi:hypothetical protein